MIVVQKYGGSSVGDVERMKRVAERIVGTRNEGHDVVVVVSAMGATTDGLVDMAARISRRPPPRELDILLAGPASVAQALVPLDDQFLRLVLLAQRQLMQLCVPCGPRARAHSGWMCSG